MIRATLKSLLSRKLRLLLSGLAVILGVMFVSGSFVLTDTLTRSFDQLFSNAFANTDVQVSAQPKLAQDQFEDSERVTSTLTPDDVDRIRAVDGVASATGVAFGEGARLIGANGKTVASVGPPRFGADWPSQAESRGATRGPRPDRRQRDRRQRGAGGLPPGSRSAIRSACSRCSRARRSPSSASSDTRADETRREAPSSSRSRCRSPRS